MRWTIATLLAVLATQACGGRATGGGAAPAPGARPTAELEALYRARTDSARMHFTEADVHFMTGMIGHHAQALVMAQMVPTHGEAPEIRTLAARIINAQNDEIATMQQWLRDRGQAVPEVHISGTELSIDGAEYAMHMPGMLTPDQIKELDAAKGIAFDRLFLRYMIQHHQGAVAMVDELFDTNGAALDELAFKIASDIQADQRTEIARMQRMLEAMPGS